MSQSESIQSTSNNIKPQVATPLKIIGALFDYYKGRESSLVQLAYKKGATQREIADALQIDPSLVSRTFSKEGSK